MDDNAQFLDHFSTIINGIAILDRSFLEMEVLKLIYAAISLAGLHILKPFEQPMIDKETTYSILMISFPKLHKELLKTPAAEMLTLQQVFYFATEKHFKEALPNPELSSHLMDVSTEYMNSLSTTSNSPKKVRLWL